MKNYVNFWLIAGWIVLSNTSCKKEITYTLPTSERKIVVNSLFNPGQPMKVQVFSSKFITDSYSSSLYQNNATVSVFRNGSLIETLPRTENGVYESTDTYPQPGETYSLEVSVPEMGTASSHTSILNPVKVLRFDSVGVSTDEWGSKMVKAAISIDDNPDEENFYRLSLWYCHHNSYFDEYGNITIYDEPYYSKLYFTSNDPVLEAESDMGYFFSDALINGKEYNIEVLIDSYIFSYWVEYFYVVVEHVSSDYYKYGVSLPAHFDAEDMKIFMEAVIVHNNIENGVGIFGSTISSSDTLYNSNFGKTDQYK